MITTTGVVHVVAGAPKPTRVEARAPRVGSKPAASRRPRAGPSVSAGHTSRTVVAVVRVVVRPGQRPTRTGARLLPPTSPPLTGAAASGAVRVVVVPPAPGQPRDGVQQFG